MPIYKVPPPTYPKPQFFPSQHKPLPPPPGPLPDRSDRRVPPPVKPKPSYRPTQQSKFNQWPPPPPNVEIQGSISPGRRHSIASTRCFPFNESISPTSPFDFPSPPPPLFQAEPRSPERSSEVWRPQEPSPFFSPTQQPKSLQGLPAPPMYETNSFISPQRRHSTSSTISPPRGNSTSPTIYHEPWSPTLPFELPILPPSKDPLAQRISAYNADFSDTQNLFAKRGPSDAFVRSKNVVGLSSSTFKSFLQDVDVSFVLFYNPCDDKSKLARNSIIQAAEMTKRPNHVYAAVNCTKECELCQKQKVTALPTMKLFARGITVNTFGEDTFLNANDMKLFVENTPAVSTRSKKRETCHVQ